MAVDYITKAGDVLDRICRDHYQRDDMLIVVLAANRGLAATGPVLLPGLKIRLPDPPAPVAVATSVRLWD